MTDITNELTLKLPYFPRNCFIFMELYKVINVCKNKQEDIAAEQTSGINNDMGHILKIYVKKSYNSWGKHFFYNVLLTELCLKYYNQKGFQSISYN